MYKHVATMKRPPVRLLPFWAVVALAVVVAAVIFAASSLFAAKFGHSVAPAGTDWVGLAISNLAFGGFSFGLAVALLAALGGFLGLLAGSVKLDGTLRLMLVSSIISLSSRASRELRPPRLLF